MHILFFNPQGNFDENDSHLTEHPDFGGQLVYVKELAKAMTSAGHTVDIVTRQIIDPDWPEFFAPIDHYQESEPGLRIVRIPCGGDAFLAKEQLWPHLDEFVSNTIQFYGDELPDFVTAHYADGGYCASLMQARTGLGFTFTGHSLGAQKMDKLGVGSENLQAMERQFQFSKRIDAERLAMQRAQRIITSTHQERMEQYAHHLYAGAINVDDEQRFSVIPPGVNTRIFTTVVSSADSTIHTALDARLKQPEKPYLLVSSRIDEKKNIAGAVKAWVGSEELIANSGLVICVRGVDDPFEQIDRLSNDEQAVLRPILDLILKSGLRDRVDFLNIQSQSELASTYRYFALRRSAFVLTAYYEPFGLAPIEAAACGLACVATKNGGPSEIFGDGSGVLVDPFDTQSIAEGMTEALNRYADLAALAEKRVLNTYTWDKTAEAYLSTIVEEVSSKKDATDSIPELDASDRIEAYFS